MPVLLVRTFRSRAVRPSWPKASARRRLAAVAALLAGALALPAGAQAAPTLGLGTYKADYGAALQPPYGPGSFGYLRLTDATLPSTHSGTFRISAPGGKSLCKARAGLQSVIDSTYVTEPIYVFALRDIKRVGKRTARNRFCTRTNNRVALYASGYLPSQPAPDRLFLSMRMGPMQPASAIAAYFSAQGYAPIRSFPPYVI